MSKVTRAATRSLRMPPAEVQERRLEMRVHPELRLPSRRWRPPGYANAFQRMSTRRRAG